MTFTITLDTLRAHQSSVKPEKWATLLLNWDLLMHIETEITGAMEAADAHCAMLLTPQPETGSIRVDYQWIGRNAVNCGPAEDDFFTYLVFKTLLKYTGV